MGAGCFKAPIEHTDAQNSQNTLHSRPTLRLPKHLATDHIDTNIKVRVNPSNPYSYQSILINSHECKELAQQKSKKTKNQIPHKRRRNVIRNKSFDMSPDQSTDEYKLLKLHPTESNNCKTDLLYEYIDYDVPPLPIRFSDSSEIWNKEYILFTNSLTNIVQNIGINSNPESCTQIIKTILEFAEMDSVYKLHLNFPINRGLWPQEYITNISKNINENSMIINDIKDKLIHSFNLQYIFEICGNCFQYKTINNVNDFFISGIYTNINNDIWNNIFISEYDNEPNDGYTSCATASSITTHTNNIINPLKFKIYSHDIMVCPKGFYIEKHNEFYEESDVDCIPNPKTTTNKNSELLYYFTLLLLPPNIQSYKGGNYKFYDVENNLKYLNDSRNCTPIPHANDKECNEYIEITANKYYWTWILFDKRVKYECDPIINGPAITFKMDIDVWRKSIKEIKQNEESNETMNQLLSGQLNIDINNSNDINYDYESIDLELSQSPNIVFPPYPIVWEDC